MRAKGDKWVIRIGIFVAVIGLIGIFLIFRNRMNETLNDTTENYLKENVEAIATTFFTKLEDQMVMLESQTRYFNDVDLTDYNTMKRTIMSTKGIGEFRSIGVASSTGATMDYNGKSAGNILLTDYFKEAISGENSISDPTAGDGEKDDLVLAVPIKKDGETVGIVYGTFDYDVLDSLVGAVRFTENAANILIDGNGNIIAKTSDTEWIREDSTNLFDEIPGLAVSGGGDKITYEYSKNGQTNIVVLTSIGVHNWYFATVVQKEIVTEQNRIVEQYVIFVIIGVALIFIILMSVIYLMNRRARRIEIANERLTSVAEQTGDIILEYDYKTKQMTMEGDIHDLFRKPKSYYNMDDIEDLLGRIDDDEIYDKIMGIGDSGEENLVAKGKILCTDMTYRWLELNVQIQRSHDGTPTRLLGNLTNIDDMMNREQDLAQQASTDLLTGLYNKVAFSEYVSGEIDRIPEGGAIVFFIIDLDNFKQVNDRLGHMMGDKVLVEVSEKLKKHFSDPDTPGRIGGDEFAACMPISMVTSEMMSRVKTRADEVCQDLKKTYTDETGEISIPVSASIGIAFCPMDATGYDELYGLTDEALYYSKNNGKGRYTIWNQLDNRTDSH